MCIRDRFFGSALAAAWRQREFLAYYFFCGAVSSFVFYLFNALRTSESVKGLGASGAIFGLMIAYAMIFGERIILAFFLIPMKVKYFVALLFALELLLLWTGTPDGIGHITHVSGAVAGAIYLKAVWRRQEQRAFGSSGAGPKTVASRMQGLEVMGEEER
ncbi:MAG: rhomboid family intramembrane serine protease, partial [Planctomycetota bacterium]|nr:rhomboid family intramembrane serine protease [Planctomycetota bacterium]